MNALIRFINRHCIRAVTVRERNSEGSIKQLNQAIDIGLQQLNAGKKVPAHANYNRLKQKINKMAKVTK